MNGSAPLQKQSLLWSLYEFFMVAVTNYHKVVAENNKFICSFIYIHLSYSYIDQNSGTSVTGFKLRF